MPNRLHHRLDDGPVARSCKSHNAAHQDLHQISIIDSSWPGLSPAIHVFLCCNSKTKTWTPGTRPGMTKERPSHRSNSAAATSLLGPLVGGRIDDLAHDIGALV